jgi:hypothetical protein
LNNVDLLLFNCGIFCIPGNAETPVAAGIATGVVLGFMVLFAAVVGSAYYCWYVHIYTFIESAALT